MKKYLAIIPVAAIVFAFVVAPAFAGRHHHRGSSVSVENWNDADVDNDVSAESDTGKNDANRNRARRVMIDTGDAISDAYADTTANENRTMISGRHSRVWVGNGNDADVDNDVSAESDTGKNDANDNGSRRGRCGRCGGRGGAVEIYTGDADSWAEATVLVNSNVTRIR